MKEIKLLLGLGLAAPILYGCWCGMIFAPWFWLVLLAGPGFLIGEAVHGFWKGGRL